MSLVNLSSTWVQSHSVCGLSTKSRSTPSDSGSQLLQTLVLMNPTTSEEGLSLRTEMPLEGLPLKKKKKNPPKRHRFGGRQGSAAGKGDGGSGFVAKAAIVPFQKHYLGREEKEPPIFTESHVSEAPSAIGSGGPDLDLLLVYGPARCHLGFPPWRIRHMGPLKSMKYGSLIKAMRKFSMVRQNYGK